MYVYIWKDVIGNPFYVGLTKRMGRTNPKNGGGRNWLTRQKLQEIGAANVVVEFHTVASIEAGQELECKLIDKYGRIQMGTGLLTNLRAGGEGMQSTSSERREQLRQAMKSPDHPIRSPAAIAKKRERMLDPAVRALFTGDLNPAKKPEVRAKLKAKWEDPAFKEKVIAARTGLKRDLPESTKETLRVNLKNNPAMQGWSKRNGDPEFDEKRIAGIQAAQPKRAEKMRDPVALAQRKERLKATLNSPEYKVKRALWDTPEYRKKLSDNKKQYWANKKKFR